MKGSSYKLICDIALIMWVICLLAGDSTSMGKLLALIILTLNVTAICKCIKLKRNDLLVLFGFMTLYSYVPIEYYFMGITITSFVECNNPVIVYKTCLILCLFHVIFLYCINFSNRVDYRVLKMTSTNSYVFYFLCAISIIMTVVTKSGENILQAGGYKESLDTSTNSPLFGYTVMFIVTAYLYAKTKCKKIIVCTIAAFYTIKDLLFGGRVDSIQLLLAFFFITFQYKWSQKKIIFIGVLFALFVFIWGIFRSDTTNALALSYIFANDNYIHVDYAEGHTEEVFYSGMRLVYMVDNGIMNIFDRISSFVGFFAYVVIPAKYLPDSVMILRYMSETYPSGGGALSPCCFYVYMGYLGVCLFAYFVSYALNHANKSKYWCIYSLYVYITVFRWFAYGGTQLIKFSVFGTLLFYLSRRLFVSFNAQNGKTNYLHE